VRRGAPRAYLEAEDRGEHGCRLPLAVVLLLQLQLLLLPSLVLLARVPPVVALEQRVQPLARPLQLARAVPQQALGAPVQGHLPRALVARRGAARGTSTAASGQCCTRCRWFATCCASTDRTHSSGMPCATPRHPRDTWNQSLKFPPLHCAWKGASA